MRLIKAQFYRVKCTVCEADIAPLEPCFDLYGDVICQYCAEDIETDDLEEVTGEDVLYRACSTFLNLDDAREY